METRLAPRITVQLKSSVDIKNEKDHSVHLASGSHMEAMVFDVSLRGLGLLVKYFLPRGIIIDVLVPGEPFGLTEEMKIKGEIKYCKYVKTHQHKCGVEFVDLSEEHRKTIGAFIAKHDKRQHPRLGLPHDQK